MTFMLISQRTRDVDPMDSALGQRVVFAGLDTHNPEFPNIVRLVNCDVPL